MSEETERTITLHEPPVCPKHGGPVPTWNVISNDGKDVHGVAGQYCYICILQAMKKLGVEMCIG